MPANINDKMTGRALLTGMVWGMFLKYQAEEQCGMQVLDVQAVMDSDGNYTSFVDVTIPSGTYRIGVISEYTIEEDP